MSAPTERTLEVNGLTSRIWEKGEGEPVGYLAPLVGLPRWTPFLDRLAERRRVIVPSLPGFPGGLGHEQLDDLADWVIATLDLLDAAGLEGADLIGASVGGTLAAEVAAFSRRSVGRLVLISPFGLFDDAEPVADVWAQRVPDVNPLLSSRPEELARHIGPDSPENPDELLENQILQTRASEATARLLWPTCDLGLRKRLHRIGAPTLLLWGSEDRVVPASYAKRFAEGIAGETEIRTVPGAGHLADFDAPDATAEAVLAFIG